MNTLKFSILVGKIAQTPGLASVLGQRNISLPEFSKSCTVLTERYLNGVFLPAKIKYVLNSSTKTVSFVVTIHTPQVSLLLSSCFVVKNIVSVRWLFILVKQKIETDRSCKFESPDSLFKSYIGSVRSNHFCIKL